MVVGRRRDSGDFGRNMDRAANAARGGSEPPVRRSLRGPASLPAHAPITDSVLDAGEAYILAAGLNSADGLIVPAALFQSLSGPEQEGLLDLLDELVPEAIDFSM